MTKPWARLSRLDAGAWHSRAFAGEPPPSLEAAARFCKAERLTALDLEIGPSPGREAADRPHRRAGGRAALGGRRRPLLLELVPPGGAQARPASCADCRAALLLDTPAERLVRRSGGARVRSGRVRLPADGCGAGRATACSRPARAGLHRERSGRSAAPVPLRHRRPDHRRRRPLLTGRQRTSVTAPRSTDAS